MKIKLIMEYEKKNCTGCSGFAARLITRTLCKGQK